MGSEINSAIEARKAEGQIAHMEIDGLSADMDEFIQEDGAVVAGLQEENSALSSFVDFSDQYSRGDSHEAGNQDLHNHYESFSGTLNLAIKGIEAQADGLRSVLKQTGDLGGAWNEDLNAMVDSIESESDPEKAFQRVSAAKDLFQLIVSRVIDNREQSLAIKGTLQRNIENESLESERDVNSLNLEAPYDNNFGMYASHVKTMANGNTAETETLRRSIDEDSHAVDLWERRSRFEKSLENMLGIKIPKSSEEDNDSEALGDIEVTSPATEAPAPVVEESPATPAAAEPTIAPIATEVPATPVAGEAPAVVEPQAAPATEADPAFESLLPFAKAVLEPDGFAYLKVLGKADALKGIRNPAELQTFLADIRIAQLSTPDDPNKGNPMIRDMLSRFSRIMS